MWRALWQKQKINPAIDTLRRHEVAVFASKKAIRRKGLSLRSNTLSLIVISFWLGTASPALTAQNAPYEGKMQRLSEVLGSLHYLRNLCGETSNEWRERMDAIIAAEKPDETERVRLISSFNHGYRAFSNTYLRCTPSALAAIDRYMKEGESLSNELISRYGN